MKLLVLVAALVLSCLMASVSAFVPSPRTLTVRASCVGWNRLGSIMSVDPGGITHTCIHIDVRLTPSTIHIHPLNQPNPTQPNQPQSSSSAVRPLAAEGPSFLEWGSRFLNELLPWGDASKGLWAGKRDAMVQK